MHADFAESACIIFTTSAHNYGIPTYHLLMVLEEAFYQNYSNADKVPFY